MRANLDELVCPRCGEMNRPRAHLVEIVVDTRGAWVVCGLCGYHGPLEGHADARSLSSLPPHDRR